MAFTTSFCCPLSFSFTPPSPVVFLPVHTPLCLITPACECARRPLRSRRPLVPNVVSSPVHDGTCSPLLCSSPTVACFDSYHFSLQALLPFRHSAALSLPRTTLRTRASQGDLRARSSGVGAPSLLH